MHTYCDYDSYVLVEFNDDFESEVIMRLMQHESCGQEEPTEHAIWHMGQHAARFSLGELPALVKGAKKGSCCDATAIVTDHMPTRMLMQLLADGLQARLPVRCRTFRTMEEAERWLAYLDSGAAHTHILETVEAIPA